MENRHEIFPVTDWTRLQKLKPGNEQEQQVVLGELYVRYKAPILVFLARKGCPPGRQEDMVQDFFLYSIEQRLFEKADPARGRFRNLILTALNHYAAKAYRHDMAGKRRPEAGWVSTDELQEVDGELKIPGGGATPEEAFDRAWAQALIGRVLKALKSECAKNARGMHFEIFRRCMVDPALSGTEAPSYKELASEHGLTEKEVSNRMITARRAYERLLHSEIAEYAGSEAEVKEEIREIFRALGGGE